jgi:hypothetical protein
VQLAGSAQANPAGINTVRIRCIAATGAYLTWGNAGITATRAPTAVSPSPNTIGMSQYAVEHLEIPSGAYFIASAAGAFECTPGQGGT